MTSKRSGSQYTGCLLHWQEANGQNIPEIPRHIFVNNTPAWRSFYKTYFLILHFSRWVEMLSWKLLLRAGTHSREHSLYFALSGKRGRGLPYQTCSVLTILYNLLNLALFSYIFHDIQIHVYVYFRVNFVRSHR